MRRNLFPAFHAGPGLALTALLSLLPFEAAALDIDGTVKFEDGSPAPQVRVFRTLQGHPNQAGSGKPEETVTDENGRFRFRKVLSGWHHLRPLKSGEGLALVGENEGWGHWVTVQNASIEARLVVRRSTSIRIRARSTEGGLVEEGKVLAPGGRTAHFLFGEAYLGAVEPGAQELRFETEFGEGSLTVNPPPGGLLDTLLQVEAAALARGRVVGPDNKPLSGVEIRAGSHPYSFSKMTDAQGRFSVPFKSGEEMRLRFMAEGYADTAVQVRKSESDQSITMKLKEVGGRLQGRLVAEVEDFKLCVVRAQPLLEDGPGPGRSGSRTSREFDGPIGPDGRFTLKGLPAGAVRFRASCQGYLWFVDTVRTGSDLGEVRLSKTVELTGQVRDAVSGAPLDTFAVFVAPTRTDAENRQRWTDLRGSVSVHAGGEYRVPSQFAGPNVVCARAEGYRMQCAVIDVAKKENLRRDLLLSPSLRLEVRVLKGGAAVPGARLALTRRSPDRGAAVRGRILPIGPGAPPPDFFGQTDAGGRFVFSEVAAGNQVLAVTEKSSLPVMREFDLEESRSLTMQLEEGHSIRGQVLEADGSPALNKAVLAYPEKKLLSKPLFPEPAGQTLVQGGRFELKPLFPGTYRLAAWGPGPEGGFLPLLSRSGIPAGSEDITLELPPRRDVRVTAFSGGKALISESLRLGISLDAPVLLSDKGSRGLPLVPPHPADPPFQGSRIVGLSVGPPYLLTVHAAHHHPRSRLLEIPRGPGPFEVRFDLTPALSLQGRIVFEGGPLSQDGYPLRFRDLHVSLHQGWPLPSEEEEGPGSGSTVPDAKGAFRLGPLGAGAFPIVVRKRNRVLYFGYASPNAGGDSLLLRVRKPGTVEGRVLLSPDMRNPPGRVYAFARQGRSLPLRSTGLRKDGSFLFVDLPPGLYLLGLADPGAALLRFEVKSADTTRLTYTPYPGNLQATVTWKKPPGFPKAGWAYLENTERKAPPSAGNRPEGLPRLFPPQNLDRVSEERPLYLPSRTETPDRALPPRLEFANLPAGSAVLHLFGLDAEAGQYHHSALPLFPEEPGPATGGTVFDPPRTGMNILLTTRGADGEKNPVTDARFLLLRDGGIKGESSGKGSTQPASGRGDLALPAREAAEVWLEGMSHPSGRLEIRGLPPGRYRLRFFHPRLLGDTRLVEVTEGSAVTEIEMEFRPGPRFLFAPVHRGFPVPGGEFSVRDSAGDLLARGPGSDSLLEIALAPGRYRIHFRQAGMTEAEQEFSAPAHPAGAPDSAFMVKLPLEPGGWVEFPDPVPSSLVLKRGKVEISAAKGAGAGPNFSGWPEEEEAPGLLGGLPTGEWKLLRPGGKSIPVPVKAGEVIPLPQPLP